MGKCSNCGASMSCGCQKRKLANGKMGCTKCATNETTNENKNAPTDVSATIKKTS
jgi:hypothetical protein